MMSSLANCLSQRSARVGCVCRSQRQTLEVKQLLKSCPVGTPRPAARRHQRHSSVLSAAQAAEPDLGVTDDSISFSEGWQDIAIALAKVADDTKCEDVVLLNVGELVSWTRYLIICTAFSRPQLLAVLGRMEKLALEQWSLRKQNNNAGSSPWECLDFGAIVVHCFTPEERERYDIEGFYAAAEEIELPFTQKGVLDTLETWRVSSR